VPTPDHPRRSFLALGLAGDAGDDLKKFTQYNRGHPTLLSQIFSY